MQDFSGGDDDDHDTSPLTTTMSIATRPKLGRHSSHNAHACNLCRQKKRRCNWTRENQTCSTCRKAGAQCEISLNPKPRPKGARKRHMQDLEERVRQMESLLTASGLDTTNLPPPLQEVQSQSGVGSDAMSSTTPDLVVEDVANGGYATMPFVPPTYGDSIAQRTPCDSSSASHDNSTALEMQPDPSYLLPMCDPDTLCQGWTLPEHPHQHSHAWMDMGPTRQQLPPPNEALLLLQEYLEDWNKAIPLFERSALRQIFQDCYSGREIDGSNAWLAVTAVLGLAHRLRGMSPIASPEDDSLAQGYKEQLLNAVPRLLMDDPTLLSVQCLVALSMLLYLSPDNNRAPHFITTALRMMEGLGLGSARQPAGTLLEDQWNSVFWIAFSLDAEMALRYGRMPSRRVADLALLDLPSSPSNEGTGEIRSTNGEWSIPFFRLRTELSTIQARVCEELLGPSTLIQQTDQKAERLKNDLAQWRSFWIFTVPPQKLMQEIHRSDTVLLTNLEASYHNTLFAIHTHMSLQQRRTAGIFDADTLLKVGLEKSQPCLADTRRMVAFIRMLPRRDIAAIYMVTHAMVASIAVLMSHATAYPDDPSAPAELRISKAMLDVIFYLSGKCRTNECRLTRQVCQHLYQQAASAVGRK